MTANQINFAKLQEDKRHNLVTEGETQRHNVADESIRAESNSIAWYSAQSTAHHYERQDAINEEHYGRMDEETARSHLAQEKIQQDELSEKIRSDKAQEAIGEKNAEAALISAKAAKSQAKTAAKNAKSNRITAEANAKNAETNAKNARINAKNAKTNAKNAETNALNAQTNATNAETARLSASVDARYKNAQILLRGSELEETQTHNRNTEENQWNANQINFVTSGTGSTKDNAAKAEIERNRASATEALARAGYLKTQDDWYAWNAIASGSKDISMAVRNFVNAGTAVLTFGFGD